jgi:putative tryptophan/tyrosine transport system substrate-binding protein
MAIGIGRRQLLVAFGSAAVARPLAARAQQGERMRRIGVITPLSSDDPEYQARNAAFLQELQSSGWTVGRNVQIDYRWGLGDTSRNRKNAAELVALAPDVILATGSPTLEPLLQATRTVPIVFVQVSDPVGTGLIESLARPGGNVTGFTSDDPGISVKWLELLKEIAPNVKRVAVIRDAATGSGIGQWGAIQAVAPSLGVDLRSVGVSDATEIERMIDAFARDSNGGLIVTASGPSIVHRQQIIALAARYRLPAVYGGRFFVNEGGLISYGHDSIDPYRRAAGYVDRILKGEKPADLPVQAPTKYELVINLKTAKTLGLPVPQSILARADEVIE